MAKRGYHGTGIKEIVDTAEVPKGSFYNYFKSKEDFGIEIVRCHSTEFWQAWAECFDHKCDNPIEALRNCFGKMLVDYEECSVWAFCIVGILAAEMCETSKICRITMHEVINEWRNNLAAHIRKAQELGIARSDVSAEDLATLFWAAWQGSLVRVKIENSTAPVKQCFTLMFDRIMSK
ncbi:MAG TPA: TetR/AcrR family transcriptional regulator [Desulfuromonadaceae bacterium]